MKSSMFAVVFTLAAAVAVTGCRYDKSNTDAGVGAAGDDGLAATDISADVTGISADDQGAAADQAQTGSLADIERGVTDFEQLYARCNDVNFAPVYFGFDATTIQPGELGKVEAVAQHLLSNGNRVVVVEGHCDERGSNEYNMSLGENRAIVVRNCLLQNGVSADRIQTRSYGEEKPAVPGEGEGAWSKNRRGEFAIFQK